MQTIGTSMKSKSPPTTKKPPYPKKTYSSIATNSLSKSPDVSPLTL